MPFYRPCPGCGASLDPGEKCHCETGSEAPHAPQDIAFDYDTHREECRALSY